MQAAAAGDFSLLRAEMAANGIAGSAEYLALAEKAYAEGKVRHEAKVAADKAAIHGVVGGPAQWALIQAWASVNADPAEKVQVNAALSQGGVAAKAMAAYLAGVYGRAVGTVVAPAAAVQPGAAGAPVVQQAMTSLDNNPEYLALNARRRASR